MITKRELKKRSSCIELIMNTHNHTLIEIKYTIDNSISKQVSCSYYETKGKCFNTYLTRLNYLYDWGYQ